MSISVPASRCRSCGQELIWALNPRTGKTLPVEHEPSEKGNILLYMGPDGRTCAQVLSKDGILVELANNPDVQLRLNHFATCVDAQRYKR